jgi:hypothetical protein
MKGEKTPMNTHSLFDKFTERARKVLSLDREEAQYFQHHAIGTEHLLLGLVREGESVAAQPFHTLMDGDVVFAITANEVTNPVLDVASLGVLTGELVWDAILTIPEA